MAETKEKKFTVNGLKYYTQANRNKNRALNDARYRKLTDKLAKTDLADALKAEIEGKADSGTTLNDYGITNAYTKDEVDNKMSRTYKAAGSKTFAELTDDLLVEANLGYVYNVKDGFTTTDKFVEGAGAKHGAGVNVAVVEATAADNSDPENPVAATYKFDVQGGFYDMSDFLTAENFEEISNEEIDAIMAEITDDEEEDETGNGD